MTSSRAGPPARPSSTSRKYRTARPPLRERSATTSWPTRDRVDVDVDAGSAVPKTDLSCLGAGVGVVGEWQEPCSRMKVGEQAMRIAVPVGCLDPVEGRIEQQQDIVEIGVTVWVRRQ
ncbi:MAG: hypothetical protein ACREX3_01205 [Gammaproteobacteria bacterium]